MGFTIKSDVEQHYETSFDSMQEVRSDIMCIMDGFSGGVWGGSNPPRVG